MKHGSLFSGIGGFDLAAEWMGWENVFHCEIAEFPRKILNHLTKGKDFGLLLKTPCAMDAYSENLNKKEQKMGNSGTLAQEIQTGFIYQRGLLPTLTTQEQTPTCMDFTNAKARMKLTQVKDGSMHSMTLTRMFCTPTSQSSRGNTSDNRGKGNLTDQIAEMDLTTSKTSQLNPLFVAEMMGFPTDWTILPFQNGETKVSKDTEMP
jgi:hypothetical protein